MNYFPSKRAVLYQYLLPPIVGRATLMILVLCSVSILTMPISAEPTSKSTQAISMTAFVEQVRQNHPQIALSKAEVEAALAKVRQAGLWQNPSIAYDREEIFENGQGLPENYFRLEFPIEISGRRSLLKDSAEKEVDAVKHETKADRIELLTGAIESYVKAAALKEKLVTQTKSKKALLKLRDSVSSRASAGDASGYDLTRIEIELSLLEDSIAETQKALFNGQLILGMLSGKPGSRLDASNPLTINGLPNPDSFNELAHENSQIAAAKARISQHSLAKDAANRGWIPSLTLTGGAKTAPYQDSTAWGYVAGIALTLPLFNHGQADKQLSEAWLNRARANLALTQQKISTRIVQAKETYSQSLKQAKKFEHEQLPRLQKLLRRTEVSYKEGERPVFELLDAYRTHREVLIRHIILKLEARLSYIKLVEALGQEPGGN